MFIIGINKYKVAFLSIEVFPSIGKIPSLKGEERSTLVRFEIWLKYCCKDLGLKRTMCKAAWKSGDYRSLIFDSWRFTVFGKVLNVFGKMDGIGSDPL